MVCDLVDREASRRVRTVALRVAGGKEEHTRELGQPPTVRQVLALDLGRRSPAEADSILEIDANGWSVKHSSGFAFRRPRGYRPLPEPELAGPEALAELKDLLGVDNDDWLRILTWLIDAMRPQGPHRILLIHSCDGSGQQAAKMLKSLVDPTASLFQPLPTNPNTVLRQATQTWVQAYDHVTSMSKQISAALCRLSTGAAFSLQFHGSPITISLARPILMTVPLGVCGAAWKPTSDLLERMLTITLPPLTEETTRPESEVVEKFLKARPKILGALAQAVSEAIRRVDQIRLTSYPRHAAAAVWAIAAAPALNTTQESLQQALSQTSQFAVPKDPLLEKLPMLLGTRDHWQGTATQLKLELDLSIAPNHLSRKLKEVQAILQAQGIEIAFPRRQESGQLIRIFKVHQAEVGLTSRSAGDLPVDSVDATSATGASTMSAPQKIDRQIVSGEQSKEETIALPPQPDRQILMPAGKGAGEEEPIKVAAEPLDGRNSLDLDRLEPGVTAPAVTVELPWTPASCTGDKGESAGAADVTIPP